MPDFQIKGTPLNFWWTPLIISFSKLEWLDMAEPCQIEVGKRQRIGVGSVVGLTVH